MGLDELAEALSLKTINLYIFPRALIRCLDITASRLQKTEVLISVEDDVVQQRDADDTTRRFELAGDLDVGWPTVQGCRWDDCGRR